MYIVFYNLILLLSYICQGLQDHENALKSYVVVYRNRANQGLGAQLLSQHYFILQVTVVLQQALEIV